MAIKMQMPKSRLIRMVTAYIAGLSLVTCAPQTGKKPQIVRIKLADPSFNVLGELDFTTGDYSIDDWGGEMELCGANTMCAISPIPFAVRNELKRLERVLELRGWTFEKRKLYPESVYYQIVLTSESDLEQWTLTFKQTARTPYAIVRTQRNSITEDWTVFESWEVTQSPEN